MEIKPIEKISSIEKYNPDKRRPSFYPTPKRERKKVIKKNINPNVINTNMDGDTFERGRTR